MRVAAIVLPELRVEVLRESPWTGTEEDERGPLGIVVAEIPASKLLGNTRLDVVSREARRLGISVGQTLAQARARVPNLRVRVVRPEDVRFALRRVAEIALSFGATVSFEEARPSEDSFGDVVWVDVTGCAHLHAPKLIEGGLLEGERTLASRLANAVASVGHACTVAIADGPRIAATIARELASRPSAGPSKANQVVVVVVPEGKSAAALRSFPVTALPLPDDDLRWLGKIGVRTIEELGALPRASLASRLGKRAYGVFAIMDGDDRTPLDAYVPPEIPEEEVSLEFGVESTEALVFVAKTLSDRMAARLSGRGMAASKIELSLSLDTGVRDTNDKKAPRHELLAVDLPSPLAEARDLLAVLKPKIERLVLRAPAIEAKLRVPTLVHKSQVPLSLFDPVPKAALALPRLVAELTSDLGDAAVGKLALGDAWVPEERTKFVRFSSKSARGKSQERLLSDVPEPTRLLDVPVPVARESLRIVRRLSRLESTAWWKDPPGKKKSFDYVYAWVDDALAWVELDRVTGNAFVRGWFD